MVRLFLGVLVAFLISANIGCQPGTEPIERVANRGFDTIDKWSDKGLAELSSRTGTLQGGAEAIEPGYRLDFGGGIFNGFIGWAELKARGLAGRASAHLQADSGQATTDERPVGDRKPPSQPAKPAEATEPTQ